MEIQNCDAIVSCISDSMSSCLPNLCENGGDCIDGAEAFACVCDMMSFAGPSCSDGTYFYHQKTWKTSSMWIREIIKKVNMLKQYIAICKMWQRMWTTSLVFYSIITILCNACYYINSFKIGLYSKQAMSYCP